MSYLKYNMNLELFKEIKIFTLYFFSINNLFIEKNEKIYFLY